MKKSRVDRIIAAGVALFIATASFSTHAQSVGPDTVVIGVPQDITDLNPLHSIEIYDQTIVGHNIFDMHLDLDRKTFDLKPHVFIEWKANEDATEWTVKIRDDIVFHNGDKLTAEDVKFSIEYAKSPESGQVLEYLWDKVTEIEVTGPHELVLRSEVPIPQQMTIGEMFMIPKKYFEEVGPEGFAEAPIGSGPYKYVEWRRGESLELEAFEDYWGGAPAIKRVIFRVLPDETSRGSSYRAGELDIATNISLEQYQDIESLKDPALGTASVHHGRLYTILDTNRPPFDNLQVRKAFNHAIDYDTIIEQLIAGLAVRIPAGLTPHEWGYNPDLKPYAYDPELAKQLLAEAGYPNGVDIQLWARTGHVALDQVAQAAKSYLDAAGFRITLSVMHRADAQKVYEDAAEQMVDGVPAPIVPEAIITNWGGNAAGVGLEFYQARLTCDVERYNYPWGGYYCSEEFGRLENEALALWAKDLDAAERKVMEMERITHEEAGIGAMYGEPQIWAKDKRLEFVLTPAMSLNMFHARWQ